MSSKNPLKTANTSSTGKAHSASVPSNRATITPTSIIKSADSRAIPCSTSDLVASTAATSADTVNKLSKKLKPSDANAAAENDNTKSNSNTDNIDDGQPMKESDPTSGVVIPDVYKTQGMATYSSCTGYSETTCLCSSIDEPSSSLSPIGKRVTYLERRNWITTDRLCDLRKKAQDAIKSHRTFTIRGCFYSIRKGLVQRGWVEKLDIHRRAPINGSCQVVLEEVTQALPLRRPGETRRQHIQKCERNIMSRFLEHIPIDFLWSARKEKTDWIDMARNPSITINKFHKSPFTTKEGLCTVLRELHWFVEEGKSETYYPRSYSVCNQEELTEFTDDYRLTACMSLLRSIVEKQKKDGLIALMDSAGQLPASCIRFAITQCQIYVRCSLHYDIDEDFDRVWDHDWEIYLAHFQMLTQENAKFTNNDPVQLKVLVDEAERILNEMNEHWPQCNLDGVFNIWIVKPSNRCRGRGIHLMNDIKKIVNYVNPPVVNKGRYVVQKYIERPLIIHNCKFDIRQWFLVTSVQPLVVWMYRESYLRFSSQEYDLVNFHESVHLTNHAIQKRYKNGKRDERLPPENMWDCYTFQAYLRQIGKANEWSEKIYPGMQKALIGTLLASQDTMDRRLNTFELFGADFMLSEDCQPWLIEINSSPDLGASTSVTARLCPQCLEDVIKVVIDYRNDPKASTGGFELIYRQVIPPAPAYLGLNLFLKGTQVLPKNGAGKREKSKDLSKTRNEMRPLLEYNNVLINKESSVTDAVTSRPFIVDLIDCINTKSETNRTPRKTLRALMTTTMATKRSSNANTIAKEATTSESPRNNRLNTISATTVNGQSGAMSQNDVIRRKSTSVKTVEPTRRHVSCGPRLTTAAPVAAAAVAIGAAAEDFVIAQSKTDIEINNNNAENKPVEHTELACVGSKCGTENENATVNTNINLTMNNSGRKQSLETTPRSTSNKPKLKPLNVVAPTATGSVSVAAAITATNPINNNSNTLHNNSNKSVPSNANINTSIINTASAINNKPASKCLSANNRDYRKYVNHLQMSKLQPKSTVNDNYCSHFFAVGLSLRAWRSKYNQMLKTQNDKVEFAQSYVPISSRKPKRLETK